jgi:hypothetical protein
MIIAVLPNHLLVVPMDTSTAREAGVANTISTTLVAQHRTPAPRPLCSVLLEQRDSTVINPALLVSMVIIGRIVITMECRLM